MKVSSSWPGYIVVAMVFLMGCSGKSGGSSAGSGDECGLDSNPNKVVVCSFVATPTAAESVTLKNYTSSNIVLNGWSIWDKNAYNNGSGQKSLGTESVISAGGTLTFTGLPFGINDSGETIYLKDSGNQVVSTKSN